MKKLKLKSKNPKAVWLEMWEKMLEGWNVTQTPKQNWLGTWVCKLEKNGSVPKMKNPPKPPKT